MIKKNGQLIIGFSNGDFYRLNKKPNERFSAEFLNYFKAEKSNAIELNCFHENLIDYLLNTKNIDLSNFIFVSLHVPDLIYANDEKTNAVLKKLNLLAKRIKIDNLIFHTDKIQDWSIFDKYKNLPISIENSDNRKNFGKTAKEIKSVLDKYNFKLTLDLQHCFVNDPTMKLAADFQKIFKDKIVEYHVSGFGDKFLHYSLFKTHQDDIIKFLKYKNIPMIIESTFDEIGEHERELKYINSLLSQ